MKNDLKSPLFEEDNLEKASEYLRLAIAMLAKHKTPATPLNYSLIYEYLAGRDLNFNEHLTTLLNDGSPLQHDDALKLYLNTFYDEEAVMESLREELLSTVAQVIGSLIDIAGKTNLSSKKLEQHIQDLAEGSSPKKVLEVVSSIVSETRQFVTETKQFEADLHASTSDITKLKEELVTARREATIDALTGLNNRRSFDAELNGLISQRRANETDFCMILLDIDHFKAVNDTHGHLIGDKVLASIANLLTSKMRGSDFTARFGGEEFVILLPNTRITNAFTVAENIRGTIEILNLVNKRTKKSIGTITASFGIAAHRINESNEGLISRCDHALYRAKKLGRNRSVLAD